MCDTRKNEEIVVALEIEALEINYEIKLLAQQLYEATNQQLDEATKKLESVIAQMLSPPVHE